MSPFDQSQPGRSPDARPGETRRRIIDTALKLFAEHGFRGVSVRDLSAAAQVNVAAVNYHFGSKQGLYRTIFETVLDEDEGRFCEALGRVASALGRAGDDPAGLAAAAALFARALVGRLTAFEQMRWFSVLVARELAFPGDLFDLLYRRRVEPVLRLLAQLVGAARGEPSTSESTRLTAQVLHGHLAGLVFARPILGRQLGWDHYTPERLDLLNRTTAELICRAIGLPAPGQPEAIGAAIASATGADTCVATAIGDPL